MARNGNQMPPWLDAAFFIGLFVIFGAITLGHAAIDAWGGC